MEPASKHPHTLELEWALRELLSALSTGEKERLTTARVLAIGTLSRMQRPAESKVEGES